MDNIYLSESVATIEGLRQMLIAHLGHNAYSQRWVSVPEALLIIEIAKRAQDKDEWFPRGKWATIQALQDRVHAELDKLPFERIHDESYCYSESV